MPSREDPGTTLMANLVDLSSVKLKMLFQGAIRQAPARRRGRSPPGEFNNNFGADAGFAGRALY